MKQYFILNRKVIYLYTNEKWKVRAKCKNPCGWFVYASKVHGEEDTLRIKTFNNKHSNYRPTYQNNNVSSTWLAKRYVDSIRLNPGRPLEVFKEQVKRDRQVAVSKTKVCRAKRKAQQLIERGFKEQYAQLWNYCAEIKRVMPNSTVFLHKD